MEATTLCDIPYPSENDDPWFGGFASMMTWFDGQNAALLQTAGNILVPPANILWNASFGQLTWDTDFVMPILSSGFNLFIRYGPDQATRSLMLNDGDKVIVTVPYTSAQNIVANFTVVPGKVDFKQGLFVFGMRYGTRFLANLPTIYT